MPFTDHKRAGRDDRRARDRPGMFGRLIENSAADILPRAVLIYVAFVALFYPDDIVSAATAAVALAATIFRVVLHRRIAPPKRV